MIAQSGVSRLAPTVPAPKAYPRPPSKARSWGRASSSHRVGKVHPGPSRDRTADNAGGVATMNKPAARADLRVARAQPATVVYRAAVAHAPARVHRTTAEDPGPTMLGAR